MTIKVLSSKCLSITTLFHELTGMLCTAYMEFEQVRTRKAIASIMGEMKGLDCGSGSVDVITRCYNTIVLETNSGIALTKLNYLYTISRTLVSNMNILNTTYSDNTASSVEDAAVYELYKLRSELAQRMVFELCVYRSAAEDLILQDFCQYNTSVGQRVAMDTHGYGRYHWDDKSLFEIYKEMGLIDSEDISMPHNITSHKEYEFLNRWSSDILIDNELVLQGRFTINPPPVTS